METFSQYQAGNYDDAIGSAQRYIGRYAQASDLDYVYYLEAMSYYNQIADVTRDQDRAQKASIVFQQIIDKFPKSQYADDARYKLQVTRDQLAGQDMMIGRYYCSSIIIQARSIASATCWRNIRPPVMPKRRCCGWRKPISPSASSARRRLRRRCWPRLPGFALVQGRLCEIAAGRLSSAGRYEFLDFQDLS